MTSSGIEPATFQLVGHCLNQLRYHVPLPQWRMGKQKSKNGYKFKTGNWEIFTNKWQCTVQLNGANCS